MNSNWNLSRELKYYVNDAISKMNKIFVEKSIMKIDADNRSLLRQSTIQYI